MLDEIDAIIINYFILGKSKEIVMSVANIDEKMYNCRFENLKKLGIDFDKISLDLNNPKLRKKYSLIHPNDIQIYKLLIEGKTINEVAEILNAKVKPTVKKFGNLGITFESVRKERNAAEIGKKEKIFLREEKERKKAEMAELIRRFQDQEKEKLKQEAEQILELAEALKNKDILFEENGRKYDSTIRDAIILYLLRTEKEGSNTRYTQSDVAKIMGVSRQRISVRVQRLKKMGIKIPKKKDSKSKNISKPKKQDLDVYNLILEGNTKDEIMNKLHINEDQYTKSIGILRSSGYKFRVATAKPEFTLDGIYKTIIMFKYMKPTASIKEISAATGVSEIAISKRIRKLKDKDYIPEKPRKISIRTLKNAVSTLLESEEIPQKSIHTIAQYYNADPKKVRKLAQYINHPSEKEKQEDDREEK